MRFITLKKLSAILLSIYISIASLTSHATIRYVNPGALSSRDEGPGDKEHPYKTISYGITQLTAGDKLIISKGVYRESIDLRNARKLIATSNVWTSIEAAPNAQVIISGADIVTDWKSLGNGLYVKYEWLNNSQQVMLNGIPLQQIGGSVFKNTQDISAIWPSRIPDGIMQMTEKSFYYDQTARSLYIKLPVNVLIESNIIEASTRPYLLFSENQDNLLLKKLYFKYSNTSAENLNGAVTLIGNNLGLHNIHVKYADSVGLDLTGNNNAVWSSLFEYCGRLGMKVRGKNVKLAGNETHYNNTRGFNKSWEAGGAKFVGDNGLQDSEIVGHHAYFNNGDGIWFDWGNANNRIHDNVIAYNKGFGIHYEASQSGRIYNNYIYGNKQRGVFLPHSTWTLVSHNLIIGNGLEGSVVIDEGRRASTMDLVPNNNLLIGNINGWNKTKEQVLPAELLNNRSNYNLYLTSTNAPKFSLGWNTKLASGLSEWRSISAQDTMSWHKFTPIPSSIASLLALQDISVDWKPILDIANSYMVRYTYNSTYQDSPDIRIGEFPPGPILN